MRLGRRTLVGAAAALPFAARGAEPERARIAIGGVTYAVPKPYLFAEFMPPGTTSDGLPPHFSFAFTMPEGGPAGEGIEFPPLTHPFEVERPDGGFVVMCYRVWSAAEHEAGPPPLVRFYNVAAADTEGHEFTSFYGMIRARILNQAEKETEFLFGSTFDKATGSEESMELTRLSDDAQFYYGRSRMEKGHTSMTVYIPAMHIERAMESLRMAGRLLKSWHA